MGGAGQGHFNAYQKERLGWLNYGASPAIQAVTAPGTYFISALQTTDASPKALKVLRTRAAGANSYYYIETRAPIGFDAAYTPGVLIHTGNESNGDTSLQIDLDPFSNAFDSMLDAGQSFTDSARNITFRTMSVDATGAWISVEMPVAPMPPPPSVTADLALSLTTATSGAQFTLTATVRNNSLLVSGLTVKFVVKDPRGAERTYTASTNSLGVATVKDRLKPNDSRGAYVATATANLGGSISTGSAGFIY
jgi:hypothetical protein